MLTRLRKTQRAIRSAANEIGVLIVLAIVLPPADWTHLEATALSKGAKTTARAAIRRSVRRWSFDVAVKCHDVCSGLDFMVRLRPERAALRWKGVAWLRAGMNADCPVRDRAAKRDHRHARPCALATLHRG
jgi:hypothetical protein